jgi:hypothetical protein
MKKHPVNPAPFKPLKWDAQMKEAAKKAALWQPPIRGIGGNRNV